MLKNQLLKWNRNYTSKLLKSEFHYSLMGYAKMKSLKEKAKKLVSQMTLEEKAEKPVLFPFGHGLSYAKFKYSDLKLDRENCSFGDKINITFGYYNTYN